MSSRPTTLGSTDREIRASLSELLSALDAEAEYLLRHQDFVADIPQSGERIRGREAMRSLQLAFPPDTKPTFTVRRITGSGDEWTVQAEGDYGGQIFHVVCIIELRDGQILHETRYYAEPFEPPAWRAHLVEPGGAAAP